jgi:hypothetical protein
VKLLGMKRALGGMEISTMRVYTLGYTRWWKSIIGFVRHDALAASYQDARYMARHWDQVAILGK